jgi:hypothetical protein
MKMATHMGAQGDVVFRRIEVLPTYARREEREGPIVVAHSETGHHHVIRSQGVVYYSTRSPLLGFLRLDGAFADVEHLRPMHKHETVRLLGRHDAPTYYEVRRQREYVPDKSTNWNPAHD